MSITVSRSADYSIIPESTPKAGERVAAYLLAEFNRPDRKSGSRLPTMRQLAKHLKVSVPTVHGAVRKLAKEGRIRTELGKGIYLVEPGQAKPDRLTIALGIAAHPDARTHAWLAGVYSGLLGAALDAPVPVSFVYASRGAWLDADISAGLLEQCRQVNGLILLPFYRDPALHDRVCAAYEQAGKPVVHLNPPTETATTNFVSPDYFGASRQLGTVWRQTGRRKILLVGGPLSRSTSARLRLAGLVAAFEDEAPQTVAYRTMQVSFPSEDAGYKIIHDELARGGKCDAVYAVSDQHALGVWRALREAGLRVPEDVSVAGGSGVDLSETACPQLTRTKQPLQRMGQLLLEMLLQRLEGRAKGTRDVGGVYLPTPFMGGATTRAEENQLLGVAAGLGTPFATEVLGQQKSTQ